MWTRADDRFDTHPKILALGEGEKGDARRWTWMRILLYTTRYQSPKIPKNIRESVPKATSNFLKTCVELGLIDVLDNQELHVHDWEEYQAGDPKKALRQAKWRANRNGTVDTNVDAHVDGYVDTNVDGTRADAHTRPSRPVPKDITQRAVSYDADDPEHEQPSDFNIDEYTSMIAKEIPL